MISRLSTFTDGQHVGEKNICLKRLKTAQNMRFAEVDRFDPWSKNDLLKKRVLTQLSRLDKPESN